MALVPIDQYKKTAPKQQSFGKLKPLAPKPVRVTQPAPVAPIVPKMPSQQMDTATRIDKSLRRFSQAAANTPKFTFADKIQNPVGRFLASAAQDLANTPSNFVRGAFGTYGQEITPSNLLKGAGQAVNVGLNVASIPGVGSVVKQGAKQGLKQGAIQGAKSGAGYGAAYGASSGIQEGENVGEQTKNALKQALLGGVVGGGLGGALGAGGAAFSNRATSRTGLAPFPRKSALPEIQGTSQLKPLPEKVNPFLKKQTSQPASRANLRAIMDIRDKALNDNNLSEYRKLSKQVDTMAEEIRSNPNLQKDIAINSRASVTSQSPLLQESRKQAHGEDIPKVIEKIKNISKPTGKERGFIESVRNSPEISQDLASRVEGTYDPKRNRVLQEQAQRTIFDNLTEAERIAKNDVGAEGGIMNTELIKHYDSIAQQAKRSGDMETFNQAMDKAVEVAQSRAANLTETAQNLQAASTISKLSPEGLLHYITKVSKDIGAPAKLSNEATYDFMRRAGEIQNILDPREKAFKTFDLIDDLAEAMPKGKSDKLLNALNLPRAIMSTGDLSAPLRQGIFTAARHPITFGKNFGKMFKYAFSEDAYRGLKADIITSPNYDLYVKHKLPLTDVSAGLTGREEAFMSNLAEKIPVFGKLAKGSNRAYAGFLNKMRVDLFDDFVNTAKLNGIKDQKYFDDAARFVGAATGRGNLFKTFEGSAPALNSIFFSPRLMASRMSLINPRFYMKLEPTVRKEAFKSLGAFVGTGMSILALAKANGAEVSTDPRSADFGKIKFGNTRYDIWGGFQQYARLIGQLVTGEKVSTITGRETTLGQGYNAPTRESIFMDFLKSKEAPLFSLLTRASQGEKYGEQFNLPVEVLDRFIPMVAGDAFDLYNEYGAKGVAGAVPGFFGVGSQTYGDQIPTMGTTDSNNPTIKWRSQPGLGETILNSVTGKEVSTLPKEQWKALYEERKQEQIRQAEVDKAKAIVLISGEPQYIGDTKIYLENGVVKTKKESKDKRTPLKDKLLYEEIQKRKSSNPFYK